MKLLGKISRIAAAIALIMVCTVDTYARRTPGDKVGVSIDNLIYDFGNISDSGPAVTHEFTMTVTGDKPVSIIQAVPSCGCTAPDYPRKPAKPGESVKIKVTFTPKGQRGEQNKEVRLRLKNGNGKSENVSLRLVGTVTPSAVDK